MEQPFARARVALSLLVALVVASGCGGGNAPSTPTSPGTSAGGTGSPSSGSLLPASATELPEFTPAQFQRLLEELEGTVVVVNVWASWCGPCRLDAALLGTMARKYAGDVQFLGVDIQDQRAPARAFIEEFDWPYPSVFDPPGAIRDDLGFVGQPVTVFFDQAGHPISVHSGALTLQDIEPQLQAMLEV
jgi:thiol-disulfide isomerase/thioredoxin